MTQLPLNGATLGFEKTLWSMTDQMRGHVDPAEYKHEYHVRDEQLTAATRAALEQAELLVAEWAV